MFAVPKVKFLGVVVGSDGISPDPDKISALKNLQAPSDVSGVRRLLGMVNHVGRFLPNLSEITAPIRQLLTKTSTWYWGPDQQEAFQSVKDALTNVTAMARYDPMFHTTVSADASSYGLGAVLLQDQPTGERRAVAYISRSLSPAETRYSQTEKEALAVTWAVERFHQFVRGIVFDIETDHRPLITLLSKAELNMMPPRIQRFRIRLMRYQYNVLYVPEKHLATADTLSRAPADPPKRNQDARALDGEITVMEVTESTAMTADTLRKHQEEDAVCIGLCRLCKDGWPNHPSKVPQLLRVLERAWQTFCHPRTPAKRHKNCGTPVASESHAVQNS